MAATGKENAVSVVVVCFDALRSDAICTDLAPNLHRFAQDATQFARHRAIFPSDTRANAATIVSGTDCRGHLVNGNAFLTGPGPTARYIDTGSSSAVELADRDVPGGLFAVPTLGEILARHGHRMVAISSASSGTTRIIHHRVSATTEHACIYCHDGSVTRPATILSAMDARFGTPPIPVSPDLDAIEYGCNAFLEFVWPELRPDCTLMWFNEPDTTYHSAGISAAATRSMLRRLDDQFGRLLDWWETEGRDQQVQLLVISDHGQINTRRRIDVVSELRAAGFKAGPATKSGVDIQVISGGIGQIYVSQERHLADLGVFLQEQPWCGLTFSHARHVSRPLDGMFDAKTVQFSNARTADIAFTFRATGEGAQSMTDYAASGARKGMHGGLHKDEMGAVCLMAGSRFDASRSIDIPTNATDILPTVLDCLDLVGPGSSKGAPLTRRAAPASGRAGWSIQTIGESRAGYRQYLRRMVIGERHIVDHGWVEP